jgi:glycosyltransferase involved in cell wall biosynthesis
VAEPPAAFGGPAGQAWEQAVLPVKARRAGCRLIVNPANLAPLAYDGNVVVVHDAAAVVEPGWYSATYVAWQRVVMPRVARRARAVIVPSEFSGNEVVELFGVDPGKVEVIAGGVDDRFSPGADSARVLQALGLERPYVLTVGGLTSRKNFGVLDEVAPALGLEGVEVVVAGESRRELERDAPASGLRYLGRVPDALLPGLYAGAGAFVLPSLHEGFGLTALEAMKSGLPVVTSRRGALPELCGEAATYVDPHDPAEITAALLDALSVERPVQAAIERASRFSWERTAEGVDALVGRLLEPGAA